MTPQAETPAAVSIRHECAFCQSPISSGERWVREKILEPIRANGSGYVRYHADLFGEEVLSCWEKHQMQQNLAADSGCPA